jgi:hypothetical protein
MRLSRTTRWAQLSAGVVSGPVPVAPGSIRRLRLAKRRTGPASTTQRIRRHPWDVTRRLRRDQSPPLRNASASTPSRRRRCGSEHDRRRSERASDLSQNPSQNFRRFATMGDDSRRHEHEKMPSQTYCGRLVPSQPNALMSIRKPTLYPLSYGGNGWQIPIFWAVSGLPSSPDPRKSQNGTTGGCRPSKRAWREVVGTQGNLGGPGT